MPYCLNCRKQIPEDIEFCPDCGNQLIGKSFSSSDNWNKRHLHWTMFFTSISFGFIYRIGRLLDTQFDTGIVSIIAYVLAVVLLVYVSIWALREKQRSLLWLLLVIPFTWIPYILLSNNSAESQVK